MQLVDIFALEAKFWRFESACRDLTERFAALRLFCRRALFAGDLQKDCVITQLLFEPFELWCWEHSLNIALNIALNLVRFNSIGSLTDCAVDFDWNGRDTVAGENVYTDVEFWPAFGKDLANARCRVIMQSSFLSHPRISELTPVIRQVINRGVTICAFVQQPKHWKTRREDLTPAQANELAAFNSFVALLTPLRVHVNIRKDIHEKVLVIDDLILWEGSLNVLSHTHKKERMRRFVDRGEAAAARELHALDTCSVCVENHRRFVGDQTVLGVVTRLVRYRKSMKLTQRQVASIAGINVSHVSSVEGGGYNMTLATLLKVAKAVDVEVMIIPRVLVPSVTQQLLNESETHHLLQNHATGKAGLSNL